MNLNLGRSKSGNSDQFSFQIIKAAYFLGYSNLSSWAAASDEQPAPSLAKGLYLIQGYLHGGRGQVLACFDYLAVRDFEMQFPHQLPRALFDSQCRRAQSCRQHNRSREPPYPVGY